MDQNNHSESSEFIDIKRFELVLGKMQEDYDFWEEMWRVVPGLSEEELKFILEELSSDFEKIETGQFQLPIYADDLVSSGSNLSNSKRNSTAVVKKKKGISWSEEEKALFVEGLEKYGKGHWKDISKHFVKSRTPTQIASHAQKVFMAEKKRTSLRNSNLPHHTHQEISPASHFPIQTTFQIPAQQPGLGAPFLSPDYLLENQIYREQNLPNFISLFPFQFNEQALLPFQFNEQALLPFQFNKQALLPFQFNEQALLPFQFNEQALLPFQFNEQALPRFQFNQQALPPRQFNQQTLPPRQLNQQTLPPNQLNQQTLPPNQLNQQTLPPNRFNQRVHHGALVPSPAYRLEHQAPQRQFAQTGYMNQMQHRMHSLNSTQRQFYQQPHAEPQSRAQQTHAEPQFRPQQTHAEPQFRPQQLHAEPQFGAQQTDAEPLFQAELTLAEHLFRAQEILDELQSITNLVNIQCFASWYITSNNATPRSGSDSCPLPTRQQTPNSMMD